MDGVKVALGNRGITVEAEWMSERWERVESPGTYVTECYMDYSLFLSRF